MQVQVGRPRVAWLGVGVGWSEAWELSRPASPFPRRLCTLARATLPDCHGDGGHS